jgi:outer membrane PBP1 activator LpoA protein
MKPALAIVAAALLLAGCATSATPPATADASGCNADAASGFVGRKADAALAEQARRAAGTGQVRVLAPDAMVTMEYLEGRLNLTVDAAGVVQGLRCG